MDFQNIRGVLRLHYNLKHLTWFKVGGEADIFFKPEDVDDLAVLLQQNDNRLPVFVLGAGSNVIIRDNGVEGIVIKLGQNFTDIELIDDNLIAVGAGCLNFNLAKFCLNHSITGFEFLLGIPGTIGGGIAMNAGCYGAEFKDIVHLALAVDAFGNQSEFTVEEIGFKHRGNSLPPGLIFTKVIFNIPGRDSPAAIRDKMSHLIETRKASQPVSAKTGGSTFVNPPGLKAWQLIDQAGMRGYQLGGARVSDVHCNFMINKANASSGDLENLGELVVSRVFERSGIHLQWEIKRVGRATV